MNGKFLATLALACVLFAAGIGIVLAAGRSEWTAGNGAGYTAAALNASGDLTSLANGSSVLMSSAQAINNQTNQDIFGIISFYTTVASATPPAGANIQVFIFQLDESGSTGAVNYGTGEFSGFGSGSTIARAPAQPPDCVIPIETAAATTVFKGTCLVLIPFNSFLAVLYNNSGAALSGTAANNKLWLITGNMQNNN